MKVLYVSTNHEHANDMHINNIRGLYEVCQIDCYGPGFSSKEELEKGIKDYISKKGIYDAIILDFALAMLQMEYLDIRLAYHWHRYLMADYSIYEAIRYADKIIDEVKKLDIVKILYYKFDPFSLTKVWEECICELLNKGFYLWEIGEEFVPEIEETEQTKIIGWGNRYLSLCKKYKKQVISMPNCSVTYKEFYQLPLEKRKYDITVPGNLSSTFYPDRIKILNQLNGTKYKIYEKYYNRTLAYADSCAEDRDTIYKREEDKILADKLRVPCQYMDSRRSRESIASWRENYNVALRESKMGYADGGLSLQILRKYVEIPARGTVLLCQDIPPLKCFGFKEWENMITVTPDSILDVCDYLYTSPKEMQRIADAGRDMVFQLHSAAVHAKHIINSIDTIKKGRFQGSHWSDGIFYID